MSGISWTSWGSTEAVGSCTLATQTCTPSCAQGDKYTHNVQIVLSSPAQAPFGLVFTEVSFEGHRFHLPWSE